MNVHFDKSRLESREDVQKYIAELEARLLNLVDNNKTIMLN